MNIKFKAISEIQSHKSASVKQSGISDYFAINKGIRADVALNYIKTKKYKNLNSYYIFKPVGSQAEFKDLQIGVLHYLGRGYDPLQ